MKSYDKWIWLPSDKYPNGQKTIYSAFMDSEKGNFTVAEFCRAYSFDKEVRRAELRFSGDTDFRLYLNGEFVATGPAAVGGDFLGNDNPRPDFYATEIEVFPNAKNLEFFAQVKMMPVKICEYSKGHGGFMLSARLTFADGSVSVVATDKTWQARQNLAYYEPYCFDSRIGQDSFVSAEEIDDMWHAKTAPIPPRSEI